MPIRDFLQSASGDLAIVDGDFALAGGTTDDENRVAVEQAIRIRLGLFLGECFLDESKGVDYLGKILIKNPDPNAVRAELTKAIAATPDVSSVTAAALVIDPTTRKASISFTVQTPYGAISGST